MRANQDVFTRANVKKINSAEQKNERFAAVSAAHYFSFLYSRAATGDDAHSFLPLVRVTIPLVDDDDKEVNR